LTELGSTLASPLASKATLRSNGAAIGVSVSGKFNLTAGPREIPRVASVPLEFGKAASFAVIKGAAIDADDSQAIANTIKNLFCFISTSF